MTTSCRHCGIELHHRWCRDAQGYLCVECWEEERAKRVHSPGVDLVPVPAWLGNQRLPDHMLPAEWFK